MPQSSPFLRGLGTVIRIWSDPRKAPHFIAYLAFGEPNVTRLQEAGPHFAAAWLTSLPCRVCVGPLLLGGAWSPWRTPVC